MAGENLYDWCIKNNRLDLIDEYDLSNDFSIHQISRGNSQYKAKWICRKCGQTYFAMLNHRTKSNGTGCPVCANKKVVAGINDLATKFPDIVKRWHPTLNGDLQPNQVAPYSQKIVWWICDKGHSFQNRIDHITNDNVICPICANQKLLVGYNDLATKFPEIAKEWDYENNNGLKPIDVLFGSNIKVFWKCKYGHTWETKISARTRQIGTGCPICAGEKAWIGHNDLQTVNPDLAKEFDCEKNNILPSEILPHSGKKYWWICKQGHSYIATATARTSGRGCPICAGKQILVGYNDLATVNSKLAVEWHPTKNGNLTPQNVTCGSDKAVWWQCEKGHSWKANIFSRNRGNGCPICAKELQTSFAEKVIAFYLMKCFDNIETNKKLDWLGKSELDVFVPALNVGIEYDGANWHKDVNRDLQKDILCEENGIHLIRIREENCPKYQTNAFCIDTKKYSADMVFLEPAICKLLSHLNAKFGCKIDLNVNVKEDYDKILQNYIVLNKEKSLSQTHPNSTKYWDYEKNGKLTPDLVTFGSQRSVWWICGKGHSYKSEIILFAIGRGCPICANKQILEGYNDLQTLDSKLASEWHPTKNENLKPNMVSISSNKKVWWMCANGHEWSAVISSRSGSQKCGCPYCSNKRAIAGETDLATTHPDILKEWDYNKNTIKPTEVSHGSDKKVWWICDKGHSWQASISSRAGKTHPGCPKCYQYYKNVNPNQISIEDI